MSVLGTVGGYLVGRTRTKIDDVAVAVASDPESRELFRALMERISELRTGVLSAGDPKTNS